MARVTLDGVTKRYGDTIAVDEMDLEIRDGEFLTLVGPSGCGKSTTMETISGLTKPTSGTVHIGDREVTDLPPKDRNISMVFQNIALFPHMDVYENISFGLRLRDFDQETIERRVERAADTVQLEGMLDRMPEEMSGGQRQRVAIARAIVREPEVFLMDEPLANLDAELRVHMRTQLQRLHNDLETTVVYVTHDQAQAMTMSDGEVTEEGFRSHSGNVSVGFDPAAVGATVGREVVLGVRPEDVLPADRADSISNPSAPVETYTDVMEPMGDEIFVYLVTEADAEVDLEDPTASGQLLMSVDPDTSITENQSLSVVLDRSNLHLFDADTEQAIAHGVVEGPGGATGTDVEAEGDD